MNDQQRNAMQMALEALSTMLTHMGMDEDEWNKPSFDQSREAITALREALEQPQGEWVDLTDDEILAIAIQYDAEEGVSDVEYGNRVLKAFKEKNTPPVVPQGEPVGYWNGKETAWFEHELCGHPAPDDCTIPLYTTPPTASQAARQMRDAAVKVCREYCQHLLYDHDIRKNWHRTKLMNDTYADLIAALPIIGEDNV